MRGYLSIFTALLYVQYAFLFESGEGQQPKDHQRVRLFEIDHEGGVRIPAESIERMRLIESPITVVSSVGLARSGKTTLVNLISGESRYTRGKGQDESSGVTWVQTGAGGSILGDLPGNMSCILLDTESLMIGRGVNSSIKLAILSLILSDSVLVNSIGELDIFLVDFIRLLISQAVAFSTSFLRKLNELSIPNKRSLKKSLIFLVESIHKTRISWMIHRSQGPDDALSSEEFSRSYKDWLKSRLEKYIWPETGQGNLYRNLNSFIERFNFYRVPFLGTERQYSGYRSKLIQSREHDPEAGEGGGQSVWWDLIRPGSADERRLTGAELADLLELFSEHSYVFNSFKPLEFGIAKGDLKTSTLVENTLLIFGSRLESQLLNESVYPLLEIEADVIYNKTLRDIESYWSSISEFDYFDFSSLLRSVQPHFERQYKSILSRNCELIRSHCADVINIHISHATHQIDQFHEKIPIPQSALTDFTASLEANTMSDIEMALNKSFGSYESNVSSYRNSPCCSIDGSQTREKIESALARLRKKNQEAVEKILLSDFEKALEVFKTQEEADDSYYKLSREEFEKKLERLRSSSRLVFNTHIALINETDLHARYWRMLNSELDGFVERRIIVWRRVCREHSYNFAKSISIRQNISIRNKLTLPLADSVIVESFERLKDDVAREMEGVYCSDEESWRDALRELMSVIEDDKEQLMKENLIALKNLLHRPLKYALRNAVEVARQHYSWTNFVREATILAQNALEDSDNWGSINIDNKTKSRVIDLWVEMDLLTIRKGFVGNQIFMVVRYLFYSLVFTIISFVTLFKNNSKLILGVVFLSFIGSVLIFSSIEFGAAGETVSHYLTDFFIHFGISRFTLYYIKHNILSILAVLIGLTCVVVYISLSFKSVGPDSGSKSKSNSFQERRKPEPSPRQKITSSSSPSSSGEKPKNQSESSTVSRTFVF
ncbi:putative transmembrane domain-containing protein [Cryptosporidium canis]|nr:putative transmembrane domain-containing protein [Cryptosporidium canis]